MRDFEFGGILAGSLRLLVLISMLGFLSACAGGSPDFENDPDLLTDTEEIPERPGVIETLTGKQIKAEF